MLNALTVDVEDYFHTEAMTRVAPPKTWERMPRRVEHNTRRLFELFERHQVRATMFFLGWVAERCPALVREAVERGHEVACHSYWHRPVYGLTPDEFRADTSLAKDVIESAAGRRVYGYRAPSFSIRQGMEWATDILAELGFTYDSSTNPIRHDNYNNPHAPRLPHRHSSGLLEIPVTTWRVHNTNLPVGGGAYLRILPFTYMQMGLSRAAAAGERIMLYLHPWEIDPTQPRLGAPLKSRLRQYIGLGRMQRRLECLLRAYRFAPVAEAFVETAAAPQECGSGAIRP
jgi:polysaccharide deacetylase family protein (PEP-CTERM system associated)